MAQQGGDWLGLQGRVCVVTGAGGGIGRAVALGMEQAGVSVVLLDSNAENCPATADVLRSTGRGRWRWSATSPTPPASPRPNALHGRSDHATSW